MDGPHTHLQLHRQNQIAQSHVLSYLVLKWANNLRMLSFLHFPSLNLFQNFLSFS